MSIEEIVVQNMSWPRWTFPILVQW